MSADLTTLRAVLVEHAADMIDRTQAAEAEHDRQMVLVAGQLAKKVLGEKAAATLGEWSCGEMYDGDELVENEDGAFLVRAHLADVDDPGMDDGHRVSLTAHLALDDERLTVDRQCRSCGSANARRTVRGLDDLHGALVEWGALR